MLTPLEFGQEQEGKEGCGQRVYLERLLPSILGLLKGCHDDARIQNRHV